MRWEGKTALKRTTLLATLFAAAALAGCTNVGGTPTTATTPPTTEMSDTGSADSPAVKLNIAKFKDKPCDILTAAQVTQLGNTKAPTTRQAALGMACEWSGKDILEDSAYEVSTATEQSFETMRGNASKSAVFSEKTIQGVRTFSADTTDGTRACATYGEAGKTGVLIVHVDVARSKVATQKPCAEAERVAAMAIENLRG